MTNILAHRLRTSTVGDMIQGPKIVTVLLRKVATKVLPNMDRINTALTKALTELLTEEQTNMVLTVTDRINTALTEALTELLTEEQTNMVVVVVGTNRIELINMALEIDMEQTRLTNIVLVIDMGLINMEPTNIHLKVPDQQHESLTQVQGTAAMEAQPNLTLLHHLLDPERTILTLHCLLVILLLLVILAHLRTIHQVVETARTDWPSIKLRNGKPANED